MLHDFIATERHLIVFLSPVALDVSRFMRQKGGFSELWSWQPGRGTEIIAVPIDDPDAAVRFAVDPFYQWHFANAFDRGGEAVVDFVRYPDFDSFRDLGDPGSGGVSPGVLCRARLDLAAETFEVEQLAADPVEFPQVHPGVAGAEHQLVWMTGGELDGLIGWDAATGKLERGTLPDGWVTSEVVFAPRRGRAAERDGYLLGMVYDAGADRSGVAVWDAARIAEPVAVAWYDHRIPITFHGVWVPFTE
jgi:all-trans-8'-apo-beta-carotenal 15,15'-oxygenase